MFNIRKLWKDTRIHCLYEIIVPLSFGIDLWGNYETV
jgi:hypothetical protein